MNHRGYSQGFEIHHIASEVKKIVRTDYFTMKQGPKKIIIAYKKQFDVALSISRSRKYQMNDVDIAMDFSMDLIMQDIQSERKLF